MKGSSFLFLATMFFVLNGAVANAVCMSNMADFQRNKAQLPPMLQQLPVMFATDSMAVTGALKIKPAGDKLALEVHVNAITGADNYSKPFYIKDVCVIGQTVTMRLESTQGASMSDGPPKITILDSNSVKISSATFNKVSESQYASITNKVNSKVGDSSAGAN